MHHSETSSQKVCFIFIPHPISLLFFRNACPGLWLWGQRTEQQSTHWPLCSGSVFLLHVKRLSFWQHWHNSHSPTSIHIPWTNLLLLNIIASWSPPCWLYLMEYVNNLHPPPSNPLSVSTRVSSLTADSAFCVDLGGGQIRFVPYMVGIYFGWHLITMHVLQHNLK